MDVRTWRTRLMFVVLPLLFALLMSLGTIAARPASAAPRATCTGPVPGQHIYDCTGLLTPTEISDLEAQAAVVDSAGAPAVVYLQVADATAQQSLQDAIDLMGRWNVESAPGAHDGFVMFFNLQPRNLRHGQVALFAGEQHYQHGNLPEKELTRIREDVMTPLLAQGQTAAGIAAGLQMVAHDLRYGPPPPPVSQTVATSIGRIPYNLLAALFALVVAFLYLRLRRQPPLSSAGDEVGVGTLAAPGDLAPGIAGALVRGRITDAQMEATMLDFARRGLLVIEPSDANSVRVQLLGNGAGLSDYERELWDRLTSTASGTQRTISSTDLATLRQNWSFSKELLRRDLTERGWYDPEAAARRRRPLLAAGAVGVVGALIAIPLLILSREGWEVIGLAIFLSGSAAAFFWAYLVPATTVEGEIAAAPWRGYAASVADRAYQPNLDTDLPYIVGLGLLGKLAPRLKAASERGYSPSWFRLPERQAGAPVGYYPYWIALHTCMVPAPSAAGHAGGSASGGFSGGGAAGGGGGSAGGF
jgi:uncharacterized membrane protein YgcG